MINSFEQYIYIILLILFFNINTYAAEGVFPNKPIRIIVPTLPGGGTDLIARLLAQGLSDRYQQAVVVDNRAGATGNIGVESVVNATADGYTMLICTNAMVAINPHLQINQKFNVLRDLLPITIIGKSPFLLVANPSLPFKTTANLLDYAKSNPYKLNYSSSGNGSATHLAGVLFNKLAGIHTTHIPYKGSSQAILDLISGEIQYRFSAVNPVLPFINNSKLLAIAITSIKRNPLLPNVPTVSENLKNYDAEIWYGAMYPVQTPRKISAKLFQDIRTHINKPEVSSKLFSDGIQIVLNTENEFSEILSQEINKWKKLIRDFKIKETL